MGITIERLMLLPEHLLKWYALELAEVAFKYWENKTKLRCPPVERLRKAYRKFLLNTDSDWSSLKYKFLRRWTQLCMIDADQHYKRVYLLALNCTNLQGKEAAIITSANAKALYLHCRSSYNVFEHFESFERETHRIYDDLYWGFIWENSE